MKKWLIAGAIAALVVCVGVYGFWSLGSVSLPRASSEIRLHVDEPLVEVRSGENGTWQSVTGDVTVSVHDEVRTGEHGRATIVFFGGSVSRLHEGTTVVVEDATHTMDRVETSVVQLRLTSGRVWSRVLSLFDLGSSFSVQTDRVVATVRGTAFDLGMSPTGTTVWVSDSSVYMKDLPTGVATPAKKEESFFMGEGHMATRRQDGTWTPVESMKTEDRSTPWFQKNMEEDHAFESDVRSALSAEFASLGTPRIGSLFERIVNASERLHIRFAGKNAPALYSAYVGRRLFAIKTLIDGGKSGLAFQAFTPLEADIVTMLQSPDAERLRPELRRTIRRCTVLLGDVSPTSPHYRLLQRLEDLNELISGDDQALRLYSRLMGIDTRFGTAARLIDSKAFEEARMNLDTAHQGILNVTKDLDLSHAGMPAMEADALTAKRDGLMAREDALRAHLTEMMETPSSSDLESTTSTPATTATSTTSGTTQKPPTTTTPPTGAASSTPVSTGASQFSKILLAAQPNPVSVGSSSQLRVTGVRMDGSTVDVTSNATFTLIGNLGTLNGSTYTATQAGSVTINASVLDGGAPKTASVTMQVQAPVTLSRIDITSSNGTTLRAGMSTALTVTATYSSGLMSAVTTKATWQTSDASIGALSGSTLTTSPNASGSVTVTATYTEGGVTKTASLPITVTSAGAATFTAPLQ